MKLTFIDKYGRKYSYKGFTLFEYWVMIQNYRNQYVRYECDGFDNEMMGIIDE